MAVNPTTQLVYLIYEYLYNRGNRLERDLLVLVDNYYHDMFSRMPERNIHSDELLELIQTKARFDEFCNIQRDMYMLLKSYQPGGYNNPDK